MARPDGADRRNSDAVQIPVHHPHAVSGRAGQVAQHPLGLRPRLDSDNHSAGRPHPSRARNRACRPTQRRPPMERPRQLDRALRTACRRLPHSAHRRRRRGERQHVQRMAAHVFSLGAAVRLGGFRIGGPVRDSQAARPRRRLRPSRARNRRRRRSDCRSAPLPKRLLQPAGGQKPPSRALGDGLLAAVALGSAEDAARSCAGRTHPRDRQPRRRRPHSVERPTLAARR